MKARRDFEVSSCGQVPQDGEVTIYFNGETFDLFDDLGRLIAECASAKRLSDYAFDNGAQSVKHDYDLKLSDGEA